MRKPRKKISAWLHCIRHKDTFRLSNESHRASSIPVHVFAPSALCCLCMARPSAPSHVLLHDPRGTCHVDRVQARPGWAPLSAPWQTLWYGCFAPDRRHGVITWGEWGCLRFVEESTRNIPSEEAPPSDRTPVTSEVHEASSPNEPLCLSL